MCAEIFGWRGRVHTVQFIATALSVRTAVSTIRTPLKGPTAWPGLFMAEIYLAIGGSFKSTGGEIKQAALIMEVLPSTMHNVVMG